MLPHLVHSIFMWFHSNISEHTVLRVKKLAESLKEKHMRWQFTFIFVFDNKKHIIVLLLFFCFCSPSFLVFFGVEFGVEEIVRLESDRIEDGSVFSWLQVLIAEVFHFRNGFINQLHFDVPFVLQVFLYFLLGFVVEVVFHAKIRAHFFVLFVYVNGQGIQLYRLLLL